MGNFWKNFGNLGGKSWNFLKNLFKGKVAPEDISRHLEEIKKDFEEDIAPEVKKEFDSGKKKGRFTWLNPMAALESRLRKVLDHAFDRMGSTLGEERPKLTACAKDLIADAKKAVQDLWPGMVNAVEEALKRTVDRLAGAIGEERPKLMGCARELIADARKEVQDLWPGMVNAVEEGVKRQGTRLLWRAFFLFGGLGIALLVVGFILFRVI